jgi:heme/copper-type cytochrome/quinol oxidase subunit 3
MTGVHWLHVLTGVVLMVIVVVGRRTPARSPGGTQSKQRPEDRPHDATEAVAYFWHFVDVVWVALFATLFLLR